MTALAEKLFELAAAHYDAGRTEEAAALCAHLVESQPNDADAWELLGLARFKLGQHAEALQAFQKATQLHPDAADIQFHLGLTLKALDQPEAAADAFANAARLDPHNPLPWFELCGALLQADRIQEAIPAFRRLLELDPSLPVHWNSYLYLLNFLPEDDPIAIRDEHARWLRVHVRPRAVEIQPHANDRNPQRRLRIGYVSPDFCNHCQSLFTIPLLSHHKHKDFEIYCYASVAHEDEWTALLRKSADVWRNVLGQSDEELARQIRSDRIDILVDLTMHMSNSRPMLFARKPAPVQAAWLAYPGTTGLPEIEYRLTDPYLDPPGQRDAWYCEKSIRLPETFWCYDPQNDQTQVKPLPASTNGFVTFGCLNNFNKVNDRTLALWTDVLRKTANSRLLVLAPRDWQRRYLLESLGNLRDRVDFADFQPRDEYLKVYHRIDVALDTFPYNGHTTSLDAMWMGVPVVSLSGRTGVSRAGFSQASNLGLEKRCVAATPEEFVNLASNFANDLPGLGELRAGLRKRMKESPLMDASRFARNMEAAYRSIWRQWCQSSPAH
jgi:protein O-GlcNAc transferase